MRISLNRANKFRVLLEKVTIPLSISITASSSANVNEIEKSFETASDELRQSIVKEFNKEHYVCVLRTLIHEANQSSGIHKIIGIISSNERLLKKLLEIKTRLSYKTGISLEDFRAEKDYRNKLEASDPTKTPPPKRYEIQVFNDDFVKHYVEKRIAEIKKATTKAQEERNEFNHKTTIELPEDMVKFLRECDLI